MRGGRRVRRVVQALRGTWQSRGVVLMYHRIADDPVDPWQLCVRPSTFRRQLDQLRRFGLEVIPLEVAAGHEGRLPRRFAVLTFDDGYADNYENALPELTDAAMPATVFVTAGAVDEGREFWWDTLIRVFLRSRVLPVRFDGSIVGLSESWDLGPAADQGAEGSAPHAGWRWDDRPTDLRQDLLRRVWSHFSSLRPDQRSIAVADLCAWAGLSLRPHSDCRPMTPDELRVLASSGLVEVGAHSWSHAMLSDLPPEDQERDFAKTRAWLREQTGQQVKGCSYPHGRYSEATIAAACRAGHAYACGSRSAGIVGRPDMMAMPRVVVNDWVDDRFHAVLTHHLGTG